MNMKLQTTLLLSSQMHVHTYAETKVLSCFAQCHVCSNYSISLSSQTLLPLAQFPHTHNRLLQYIQKIYDDTAEFVIAFFASSGPLHMPEHAITLVDYSEHK